jgi:hypothetical protein
MAAAIFLAAVLAGACKTTAAPAVLTQADDATMGRLKAALAKAMGQAEVQLGPGDPTQSSVVSVLPLPPGPLEDRSLAKPTTFHLVIEDGACLLVRAETGERIKLEGVTCRAAA